MHDILVSGPWYIVILWGFFAAIGWNLGNRFIDLVFWLVGLTRRPADRPARP